MLILSTLEVFVTWVVVAIILIGLGSLLLSRFTKNFFPTDAFWMGLAVSVAVLEIWNLILPITASTTLILSCAGILGLALNSSSLLTSWRVAWQALAGCSSSALRLHSSSLSALAALASIPTPACTAPRRSVGSRRTRQFPAWQISMEDLATSVPSFFALPR